MAVNRVIQQDLFKEEFKRYKRRSPAADLSDVVDLRHPERFAEEVCLMTCSPAVNGRGEATAASLGLKPPSQWRVYQFVPVPGLYVIPNPFQIGCQHHWVRECLVSYPCRPNVCNLDAHQEREGRGAVWPGELAPSGDEERYSFGLGCDYEFQGEGLKTRLLFVEAAKKPRLCKDDLLYRLRWVTLGYHYDWDKKEYHSQCKSPFPDDLAELSKFILEAAGFPGFLPEAAIVNYYHLDSTLSGHTDHSEKDLSRPLLSISFGQSAVFLIGGQTKAIRPRALLLNSGDIIIMSGESRLAYHGVPRILPPLDGTRPVPECLSLEALKQCGMIGRTTRVTEENGKVEVCCRCGRVWRKEKDGALHQLRTVSEVHEGGSTIRSSSTSQVEASPDSKLTASPPHKRQLSDTVVDDTGDTGCHGDTGCPSCQELVLSWPLFVSYLSVSRINANVRQVVSGSATFDF